MYNDTFTINTITIYEYKIRFFILQMFWWVTQTQQISPIKTCTNEWISISIWVCVWSYRGRLLCLLSIYFRWSNVIVEKNCVSFNKCTSCVIVNMFLYWIWSGSDKIRSIFSCLKRGCAERTTAIECKWLSLEYILLMPILQAIPWENSKHFSFYWQLFKWSSFTLVKLVFRCEIGKNAVTYMRIS